MGVYPMLESVTVRGNRDEEDAMGICGTRICQKRGALQDRDEAIVARQL